MHTQDGPISVQELAATMDTKGAEVCGCVCVCASVQELAATMNTKGTEVRVRAHTRLSVCTSVRELAANMDTKGT